MTFLPIVERELRVTARLTATYRNRSLIAGAVALVALGTLFIGSFRWALSVVGGTMFQMLSALALLFCVVEGARKTADCLSEEKREGTLGLLFLTDLRGYDIVLGKLAGTSLNSVYGLISIFPVLALPLLLGGVLAGEYWRTVLALLNILFLSLCLGMFVSAISREEQKAMGSVLLIMALLCILPWLPLPISLGALDPVSAYYKAFELYYRGGVGEYWESLVAGQILSWLLLVGACVAVPRSWQERSMASRGTWWRNWLARWPRYVAWRARRRVESLAFNPIIWLAERQPGVRFGLGSFVVIAAMAAVAFCLGGGGGSEFYVGGCWMLNMAVKGLLTVEACRCNAAAKRNNTLEMLLVTPLTAKQIINGQIQGLMRVFVPFVLVILGIEIAGYILGMAISSPGDDFGVAAIVGLGYVLLFALDMGAVMWAGLWFGLTAKKESQAIAKTILLVLVLPYASLLFFAFCFCPGWLLFFFSSALWMFWARGQLQTKFRERASRGDGLARPAASAMFIPQFNRQPPLPPIINS